MSQKSDVLIISDFNTEVLTGLFNNDNSNPKLSAISSGFDQLFSTLLNRSLSIWEEKKISIIWCNPESLSKTFSSAKLLERVMHKNAIIEVDNFCDAIIESKQHVETIFVITWHMFNHDYGYGMLEQKKNIGIRSLLNRMNARLVDRLNNYNSIFVLDSSRWFECKNPFNEKMWYLTKVPFSNTVFKSAIDDVKSALRGINGDSRKIVICDLDNTIWGGVVGDIGWRRLNLGGHDPLGEAFIDVQRILKSFTLRGIVLAIVSKNTEEVALNAIDSHPEMILQKNDFVGWRINWKDKAQNIIDLMKELNLGLQSAVFLDDNPIERSRIKEALPEIFVPELPNDKLNYPSTLRSLNCFNVPTLTSEDYSRTDMYKDEQKRDLSLRERKMISLDDWLYTLKIKVHVERLNNNNIHRASQLFNKTNQMNLSTRRMSETELNKWVNNPQHYLWVFRVSDKFGKSGITGIGSLEIDNKKNTAIITDFILSCRVMGRNIEKVVVYHLINQAKSFGCSKVLAKYKFSKKNAPCFEFWQYSKFKQHDNNTFVWNLKDKYLMPESVNLVVV